MTTHWYFILEPVKPEPAFPPTAGDCVPSEKGSVPSGWFFPRLDNPRRIHVTCQPLSNSAEPSPRDSWSTQGLHCLRRAGITFLQVLGRLCQLPWLGESLAHSRRPLFCYRASDHYRLGGLKAPSQESKSLFCLDFYQGK